MHSRRSSGCPSAQIFVVLLILAANRATPSPLFGGSDFSPPTLATPPPAFVAKMKERMDDGSGGEGIGGRVRQPRIGAAVESETDAGNFGDEPRKGRRTKRILLIRHGCTHMNEYLATPGCRWGDPGFTDIFPPSAGTDLYRDSPLSPRGIRQAHRLSSRLGRLREGGLVDGRPDEDADMALRPENQDVVSELELIAVSPLTRALQTLELGLLPHVDPSSADGDGNGGGVRIVAQPLASERVYLVSDIGSDPSALSQRFPDVDFSTELQSGYSSVKGEWWFTLQEDDEGNNGNKATSATVGGDGRGTLPPSPSRVEYVEWRPSDGGQTYAHPGEPERCFHGRMMALYDWLDSRPELTIALISHWGVLQWLVGAEFENCEMRVANFNDDFRRTGHMPSLEDEEEQHSRVGEQNGEEQ